MSVSVIGAGPTGLISAYEAAKREADVVIFEEHKNIGVPVRCAGLLSVSGLKRLGLPISKRFILNFVKGAIFYSPSGLSFRVYRKTPVACVVDRASFDCFLADKALNCGVEIKLGFRVSKVKRLNNEIAVSGVWGSKSYPLLIDAEGFRSLILKQLNLQTINWRDVLPSAQIELKVNDIEEDFVEVHVGKNIAPGFFAWVIPLNHESARIGLACKGLNPRKMLKRFIKRRFGVNVEVKSYGGCVLTCGPIPKTYADNLIVVGDAAGQVKPTTGGGVILGGLCAIKAGFVASEAIRQENFSSKFLRMYEKLWKKEFGHEFKTMKFVRDLLNRIPDKWIDKIFDFIVRERLYEDFSILGDMDMQSTVLGILFKRFILKFPFLLLGL